MKTIKTAAVCLAVTALVLPASAGTLVVTPKGNDKEIIVVNDGLPGQSEIKGVGIRDGKASPKSADPSPEAMFQPGMPDGATNKGARDTVDFKG